jgi:hypothetical protein
MRARVANDETRSAHGEILEKSGVRGERDHKLVLAGVDLVVVVPARSLIVAEGQIAALGDFERRRVQAVRDHNALHQRQPHPNARLERDFIGINCFDGHKRDQIPGRPWARAGSGVATG